MSGPQMEGNIQNQAAETTTDFIRCGQSFTPIKVGSITSRLLIEHIIWLILSFSNYSHVFMSKTYKSQSMPTPIFLAKFEQGPYE